jgi:exodeoxyribonuclease VII small subunit
MVNLHQYYLNPTTTTNPNYFKHSVMKQEPQFETIIQELESIVGDLEQSIGLEEALKKYQKGITLAKQAEKRLKDIENQFEKLQVEFSPPAEESEENLLNKPSVPETARTSDDKDENLDSLPF